MKRVVTIGSLSNEKLVSYDEVQEKIMRQTLEALWFEGILSCDRTDRTWKTCGISSGGQPVIYSCEAEEKYSFGRIKIVKGSLKREGAPCTDLHLFLEELVLNHLDGPQVPSFIHELLETLAKDYQSRLVIPDCIPDQDRHYDALESHMTDGHPYHPSYKSRLGFSLEDNQTYGPEFNQKIHLYWVAVKEELMDTALSTGYTEEELYGQHLTEKDRQRFTRILEQEGDGSKYVLIPVHPWQWERKLGAVFTHQRINRQLIPLGTSESPYRAQQSIRSLSNRKRNDASYIKLSLSITNTSTSRILAHHTTQNAPRISDWLDDLIRQDEFLQREQFHILKEVMGVSFRYEEMSTVQYQSAYGTLGAIWRENISTYLLEREDAWPLNALMLVQKNNEPFIRKVIDQHGIKRWSEALIQTLVRPIIHLLYSHGIALESHAQNIILVLEDGLPKRMIIKDLHDSVRYVPNTLLYPQLAPNLHPEPETHRKFNRYSFIHAAHVSEVRDYTYDAFFFICMTELALTLEHFGLPEQEFWRQCAATIDQYQKEHPEYRERFEWFDLFSEEALIEEMTKRRIYGDSELFFRKVANPLRRAREGLL
ncbi:IucA/IucC family protein [Paenibacillus puldeungensis]|uniref:IucA/IucC family protein n=1 Tax=Paenibacillus puldeungensis TaxID=696536 RepID=A0ABW3RU87_9BACL